MLLVGDSWARQMFDDGALAGALAAHGHASPQTHREVRREAERRMGTERERPIERR